MLNQIKKLISILPFVFKQEGGILRGLKDLVSQSSLRGFRAYFSSFPNPHTLESLAVPPPRWQLSRDQWKGRGYVIYAPDYVENSAGAKVLYLLCHELNERGYPSFMCGGVYSPPHLKAPIISLNEAIQKAHEGFIAVYPEVTRGNLFQARTIARWVLNRPGLLGGARVYDSNELVFYYTEAYRNSIRNRIEGKLYLSTLDETLFYYDPDQPPESRVLDCFYIGKSVYRDGIFDRNQVYEITRQSPRRQELGDLFRRTRVLYCFDNSTILTYEALLCGCRVVLIPDGTQTRAAFESTELGMEGITWWTGQRDLEPLSVSVIQSRVEKMNQESARQIDEFIQITQTN